MSELLVNILEKYKARSGDEQDFMDKHTDEVEVTNAPGREGSSEGEKRKKHDRKKTRQGRDEGEDEEVYEEYLLSIIDEAIDELIDELDEEEKAALQEMVSDDQQYEDFVESVFADNDLELFLEEDEKEEDDDDDSSDDDDDEDDDDKKDAKINVNPKEKNKKDDVSEAKVDAKKVEAFIKKHLGTTRYNKVKGDVRTMENKKGDLVISDRGHVLKTVPKGEWEDDFPLKEDVSLDEAKDIETWRITYSYGAGKGGQRETTRIMTGLKPGTSEDDVKKIWDKKHPGKKFISAIKENVELDESFSASLWTGAAVVARNLGLKGLASEFSYTAKVKNTEAAIKKMTPADIKAFIKDAQGLYAHLPKSKQRYFKKKIDRLEILLNKENPTELDRRTMVYTMEEIAGYVAKIKDDADSVNEEVLDEGRALYSGIANTLWRTEKIKSTVDKRTQSIKLDDYPLFISVGDMDKSIGVFDENTGDLLFQGTKSKVITWIKRFIDSNEFKLILNYHSNEYGKHGNDKKPVFVVSDKNEKTVIKIDASDINAIEKSIKRFQNNFVLTPDYSEIKVDKNSKNGLMKELSKYKINPKSRVNEESLDEGFSKWSVELPSFKKTIEVDKARSKAEAIKKAVAKAGGKPDDWKHTKIGKVEKLSEEVLEEGDSTFTWKKVNSVLQHKGYNPKKIADLSVKLKGKLNGGNVKWTDLNDALVDSKISTSNIGKLLIALKQ